MKEQTDKKEVINSQLDDKEIKAAAAKEKEREAKLGHKDDGHYLILEMDQESGAQSLIAAPNLNIPVVDADGKQALDPESGDPMYQWQALVFAHPEQAKAWIAERGERRFSYLVLSAVGAYVGEKSPEEIQRLAETEMQAMQDAVAKDQEDRRGE